MPRFRSLLPNVSSRALRSDVLLRLVALVVFCAVLYRYCWIDYHDPFKCGALLHEGDWLDARDSAGSQTTFQNWQPPGCMLHEYKKEEIRSCLGKKRIVVIGDSNTRQIFWAFARKLDAERAETEMEELLDADSDVEFNADGITLQYVWDPSLNSPLTQTELEAFQKTAHHQFADNAGTVEIAGLILLGSPGLWFARYGGINHIKEFKEPVDDIVLFMDHTPYSRKGTTGDWAIPSSKDASRNLLLMAPVRTPWYDSLSPAHQENLTPERIDPLNEYLSELSSWQVADVAWSFANMTWQQKLAYQENGLDVIRDIANTEADILLNLRCNAASAERGVYPHDGTCCMNYRRPDWRQRTVILNALATAFLLWINRRNHVLGRARFIPSPELLKPFSIFLLILSFCFFADRTQLFEKEHKSFVQSEFILACAITILIGVLSIRKEIISLQKVSTTAVQRGYEQSFLSRNQTDEWKGWMQALLLIYHYTGATKSLEGIEISQILAAGYLFMTGYGHTMYFLTTDDYSLNRVAHVLIRLNLFVCTLAYMMRTDYTFYHFAPLVSFWFLVVYYILRIKRSLNHQPIYLVLKIVVFGCVLTAIVLTPSVLESIFIVLRFTSRIGWDVPELQGLISQDILIVYTGMIFAAISLRYSSLSQEPAPPQSIIDAPFHYIRKHPRPSKVISILIAMITFPMYFLLTTKPLHPYLSPISILAFLALRNSTTYLQTHHSPLFIWLGRHSLELYLLSHHIFLAGDAHGILRLGLLGRKTEFLIITALFLWVASKLRDVVRSLGEWILSGNISSIGRRQSIGMGGNGEWDGRREGEDLGLAPLQLQTGGWEMEILGASGVEDGEGTPSKSHGVGMLGVWGDIRVRIGVVVVVAWIFNITYR